MFDPTSRFNSIIYRPGGTSAGDVLATWAEVKSFIQASSNGKCIVYVDDSITSPALVPGATGVTNCFGRVELRPFLTDSLNFSVLQVEPGATLLDLYSVAGCELRCNPQTVTPSLDFTSTSGGLLIVQDFGLLSNAATATAPAISIPAGKLFDLDLMEGNLSPPAFGPFTTPFIAIAAGGSLSLFAVDGTFVAGNYASGAGNVIFDYDNTVAFLFATPGVVPPLPGLTGTYTTHNVDGVWVTKLLDPTTMGAPAVGNVPVFNADNTWHAAIPPLSPTGFGAIIYKPGTPSAADHVATWPEVQAFITATDGKCIVYVDDSIVSPALVPGATAITECFGRVELRPFATDALLFTTLQIEPGATLNNLWAITAMELRCNPQTATPSLDFTLTAGGGYLALTQFGALTNATTATTPAISLATGRQLYIDLEQGLLALNNAGDFINFTVPLIAMAGTAEVFVNAYDGSVVGANFASGTGSVLFFYDTPTADLFQPTAGTPGALPAFTGSYSTSNSDHPLTTEWGTQATWFIDPQNVTGLADDQNSGIDATHPVQSYNGGIVQKWGTVSPTIKQNTTLTWLSPQTTNSDPVIFTPAVEDAVVVINATFGAGQTVHTGALASVTPKNRATPQLLQADLGFAAAIGSFVQNTTAGKSSLAQVYKLIAGTTFALTQPLTPVTAPVDVNAAQAVTEVDTWANGDTFNVLVPISVNIVKIDPVTTQYQVVPLFFPASVQLQHLDISMPGGGPTTTSAFIGNDVSILECSADASIADTSANTDLAGYFINIFASQGIFSTIGTNLARAMYGGALIVSGDVGPTSFCGTFDFDSIIDATVVGVPFFIEMEKTTGFNHQALLYIAGDVRFGGSIGFDPATTASGQSILWGPGSLDAVGSARLFYVPTAGAAVATFLITGGMKLNGQANANAFDPSSGLFSAPIPITAANLDTAFGAGGFGGLAMNLGGASLTNQGTN